ncbi:MAG TPA: 4'-phosphopantetheinyl transferase superfamily protein [Arenibacter sp.]|nr:4'-phosphopantetheinyl transferase superfamily protein [Arenibacter sp.]
MPLYKTITVDPHVKILIWKVEETEAQLSEGVVLTPKCGDRLMGMRSELHRRGFLSIRHLLAVAGYVDHDLFYDDLGKPHLEDGRFISITHSHGFTGIILSEIDEVGIDIELQREKILGIANKFTPLEEYKTVANADALVRKLTIVWGAKESLFKIYAQPGLSFLHHIDITDFSLSDTNTTGTIIYKGKTSYYDISFMEFEGYTCVYAIKK